MRIWITEIGEPLPVEESARLLRYGMWTREFARNGHEAVWWTSSFSHFEKKSLFSADTEKTVNGVKLKVLHGPGYRKNVSLARILHQRDFATKFYRQATDELRRGNRPDVIISPVPTLEISRVAVRLGRQHGIPVLIDVRDEWPDEWVDLFPVGFRWAGRLALSPYFRDMRSICNGATGILGVSRRFLEYGLKFAGRERRLTDHVFPIGYSLQATTPQDEEQLRAAHKWWLAQGVAPDAFVCCVFASLGPFFDLETVIQSAERLSTEFKIQIVICGKGSTLPHLKKVARDNPAIIFAGWVDAPKISALMRLSKVGLAPYSCRARMTLPNKPFEYFAGSLAVVSSIQSELKELLAEHQCGKTYRSDSIEEFSAAIRELHANPGLCADMGRRGRQLLESRYSVETVSKEVLRHLEGVINAYGTAKLSDSN